jgi:hypothetical protein
MSFVMSSKQPYKNGFYYNQSDTGLLLKVEGKVVNCYVTGIWWPNQTSKSEDPQPKKKTGGFKTFEFFFILKQRGLLWSIK